MFSIATLNRRDERGQTALETAIILIAFIVVATVFAFTILSAGSSSTEKGEEAIAAGLQGVQSSMHTQGSIYAKDVSASGNVEQVVFTVALVGNDPIDLTDTGGDNIVVISYRDADQLVNEVPWTVAFIGDADADTILEPGEIAEITVDLTGLTTPLATNTEFELEIKPPVGGVIPISKTTPAAIDPVTVLN